MARRAFVPVVLAATLGGLMLSAAPAPLMGGNQALAAAVGDLPTLTVNAANRNLTRLALIIAWDQGLYKKYGVDINLLIPKPSGPGMGKEIPPKPGMEKAKPDVVLQGGTPMIIAAAKTPDKPHNVDVAGIDCNVRVNIIGAKGSKATIKTLADLKGKKIGVSGMTSTIGYQARLLAKRMGWNYQTDVQFVQVMGEGLDEVAAGKADVTLDNEIGYSEAKARGMDLLFDEGDWKEQVGGNSIAVDPVWLKDPKNRENVKRFLMAVQEGTAIMMNKPDIAKRVMREWNGETDETLMNDIVARSKYLSRDIHACVDGLKQTIEMFPDQGTSNFKTADFYDNSIMDELAKSGFIKQVYN